MFPQFRCRTGHLTHGLGSAGPGEAPAPSSGGVTWERGCVFTTSWPERDDRCRPPLGPALAARGGRERGPHETATVDAPPRPLPPSRAAPVVRDHSDSVAASVDDRSARRALVVEPRQQFTHRLDVTAQLHGDRAGPLAAAIRHDHLHPHDPRPASASLRRSAGRRSTMRRQKADIGGMQLAWAMRTPPRKAPPPHGCCARTRAHVRPRRARPAADGDRGATAT